MKLFVRNNKIIIIYASAAAFFLTAAALALLLGSTRVSLSEIVGVIFGGTADTPEARIVRFVRLPRAIATLACGAALAVSGAVIQCVLANRLASPSVIGVSSGAGLAVTVLAAFGIVGGVWVSLVAFIGAFLTVVPVSLGAKRWGASRGTVLLIGVALNSLFGAISDTVITFAPDVGIISNDFKVGDFSSVTYSTVMPAALLICLGLAILFLLSNRLDVLQLGDDIARGLGMNTDIMRVVFLLLAALLAGAAVSVAGLLSFVGLLVPHTVRRLCGSDTRRLLPLCALFGGGFVTVCDTVSRVVLAPYELPVGIITAFLGAPFFIFILVKRKGGEGRA